MSGVTRRFLFQLAPMIFIGTLVIGAPVASDDSPHESVRKGGRIPRALEILAHVPAGNALLQRAQRFWGLARPEDLKNVLKWGHSSKTDAVLTRHFNPKTGLESRERQVTIYLRESQPLDDLVLDIAHELVHATSRPGWDPYDPKLTPGKYIWAAIEGEGGEVDAVAAECRVGFELHSWYGVAGLSSKRCQGYLSKGPRKRLDTELIRRDFYRVGKWNEELRSLLGAERSLFPLLTSELPRLYSSTGNAPYPVALLREFEEITQIACENSQRRADLAPLGRAPAALPDGTAQFLSHRCEKKTLRADSR